MLNSEKGKGEMLVYQGKDGGMKLEVRLQGETMRLTINQMAQLFGVDKSGISRHLKNIFETGELQQEATAAKFAAVQNEDGRARIRISGVNSFNEWRRLNYSKRF
jgi:hypothetical protein